MNEQGVFRRISTEKTKFDQTLVRQGKVGEFTVYSNQVKSPYLGENKSMDWSSVPPNCSKVMTRAEKENQVTCLSAAQRPELEFNQPSQDKVAQPLSAKDSLFLLQ